MKISKILFALTFAILISTVVFASEKAVTNAVDVENADAVSFKIKSIIQNLDINPKELKSKTIKIKFIINENDQLVVLSTGDSTLDSTIKNALNYEHVDIADLKYNKVYILPITFQ